MIIESTIKLDSRDICKMSSNFKYILLEHLMLLYHVDLLRMIYFVFDVDLIFSYILIVEITTAWHILIPFLVHV